MIYIKLIYCPKCHDVVRLFFEVRTCKCGSCSGRYLEDGLKAEISKDAVPLGFDNYSFMGAICNRRDIDFGSGERFKAFIIPRICGSIEVL